MTGTAMRILPVLAVALLWGGCMGAIVQQRDGQYQREPMPIGEGAAHRDPQRGPAYELPTMEVEKIAASASDFVTTASGANTVVAQLYNGTGWRLDRVHVRGIARDENGATLWTRRFEILSFRDRRGSELPVVPPLQAVVAEFVYGDVRRPHSLALTPVAAWGWRMEETDKEP